MKKIFLFILLFAGFANAQIVNIPDPFFKLKLVSASATDPQNSTAKNFSDQWMTIDANGDGEIQLSEAQAVKLLIVGHYAITDLTGLNSFSNLQSLQIKTNQASSLNINALTDLTTLSIDSIRNVTSLTINNANLTSVICVGLYNLTSLNVSNLINMTSLSVIECGLTTLNVNGLTNLTELNCLGNKLTNLNGLSTNLTKLNCSYNLLTSLNLSTLTHLTDLDCSANQLTNFNSAGLTNLTDLNCGGNLITNLDVNALPNLVNLICSANNLINFSISGLTHLTTLNCGGNNQLISVSLNNLPALQDFKVVNSVDMQANPIGHLTSLTLSGLPNLQKLDCSNGILTSLDLNGLTNLTEVSCSRNQITTLNVSNLPNLQKLVCDTNQITNLDVSNMLSLVELRCAGGYVLDGQTMGILRNLNVSGSTNLKKLYCSYNLLTTLNVNGLIHLEELYCDGLGNNLGLLTSLNVNSLSSLKKLSCSSQQLTSLNVSNLINLTDLYCSYNHITSLDLTGLINLKTLDYNYNQLANLNLVNLPSLTSLNCANNQLVTLNVLNLSSLKDLNCSVNQLTTLNLSGLSALETLSYSYNQIALSNVSGLSTNLKSLYCDNNTLTSLDVSNLPNLERLSCANNLLTSIDLSSLNNLKFLDISTNQLTTIDVSNLTVLEYLDVYQNQLTALNLNGLTTLIQLAYSENVIPNLDVNFLINLENLMCDSTQSTVLDVSNLTKLQNLSCAYNQLTALDVTASPNLRLLQCQSNQLTTLDLSNAAYFQSLSCYDNLLETLYVKNGSKEQALTFSNNSNLRYICADESQIESIQTQLNDLGMNTTVSNSYCSFTPGGNHNTITGIAIFDADNNGCDASDVVNPFVKLNINDGTLNGATVTNINGTYNFYTNAGDYVISPNTENPTWFSFSPSSADFTFANANNNISTQNFCIAAVGLHKDVEVVFAPLESARPGFDAKYKIVFKNKGNQMQSGTVTLAFDDARTDVVSAMPATDVAIANSLSWNFTNLMPFENRSIELTLNINGPMEIPAVNNGDILNFTTSITPIIGDDFPSDNQFNYNQTVIGSFDPNDIICLEGETVAPVEIGNYLHYMVNFENTGTAAAENIVVTLDVNPDEFDINSLQVMNASHPAFAEVRNNTVEFKFANINLAPSAGDPPVSGHGNILFKMKSKATLETGDLVKNRANIFFDYNFPIVTNDAETTFEVLSTDVFTNDESVVVFPNPAQDKININCNNTIKSIELYDVQGRVLEVFAANKISAQINISDKSKGIYFVKIITEKGKKVQKIIKE
ncbi:hypothetical protein FNO01nite_27230 [Flavobacterium noncentrifugens]|uniref:Por secretion system C-terminal sorting domain-containing protein n=1 Tax=Flavobacterium noncentrifugens TaxID=1128970 RepID=A0A1G9CIT9_9FLAO|nr:leucine-rich repeat domain-containing protein [Flavobacterium noncentrifugens]GEP52051.1 hypothetical protein FNO01nite_27230 [Flavobacterium noncentrifugens]SDK51550.1 Por secretion system C-terminal sorting domain-containing protein [Flavobacterium noncentrifugens]